MNEVKHIVPNAFGRKETVIVETEDEDMNYRFHVSDGEIEKVSWESKDHGDYGTKLISSVNKETREAVIEAANNA